VLAGSTPAAALRAAVDTAVAAERLGYHRFWVAEHHNMPSVASSAPAVLLAHAATVTSTIRIGSGGVMLPNHAPLVVAEQFGMLEALHPGRIDLGIGRAPGTDRVTMHALRRTADESVEDFPRHFGELLSFFDGDWPEEHAYRPIRARPHARGSRRVQLHAGREGVHQGMDGAARRGPARRREGRPRRSRRRDRRRRADAGGRLLRRPGALTGARSGGVARK